ncbi:MAG: LppX_LprAFG lipoprotein [Chloroflexi bacterium]|nr:LppX_LprAFG lipoprotein [Chloroflexota bacterium]
MIANIYGLKYVVLMAILLSISLSCSGPTGAGLSDTITKDVLTPTPTPINPQAVLDQSGTAMASLESFHFDLQHSTGGTPLAANLLLISAEGYVEKPDRLAVEFTGSVGRFAMRGSLITIGDRTFMTNPLNDEWQVLQDQVSPLAYFDPAKGISSMMSQVTAPTLLAIHSKEVHIGGRLPATALSPLFGPTADGSIDVEMTIDLSESYLTKIMLDGPVTETEMAGVVRTIVLDQFNEPTSIEPPQ